MKDNSKTKEQLIDELAAMHRQIVELEEERWGLTEASLRESKKRYRRLLESTTDYIYRVQLKDGQAVKTSHGAACVSVTGYTPDDYLIDPDLWHRMICKEDLEMVASSLSSIFSGIVPPPLEHRIIHKDGSLRWIRNTLMPQFDEYGDIAAYDGLVRDITERKNLENDLVDKLKIINKSHNEWRATFDSISTPIVIHDPEFRIVKANMAYSGLAGMPFEEIIGRPYYEVFPGMKGPSRSCLKAMEKNNGKRQEEICSHSLDRTFKINVYPQFDDNGKQMRHIHIMEDVTEAKMAHKMLSQSAKLASLGELAANIAHEINNPMTAVLGYTSVILEEMECGERNYEELKAVERESLRVRGIVRNLLVRGLVEKENDPRDQRVSLYKPTMKLLSYLGIQKIEDMPQYNEVKKEINKFEEEDKEEEKNGD